MPFVLCADFTIFPDGLQLGPIFSLSGMDFQDAPGAAATSSVNRTSGLNGLQFPEPGIEVGLPIPVPWVRIHVGQFNKPFVIESIDPGGTTITNFTVNTPNSYSFVNLSTGEIAKIRFTGGGHEGVIVSICILVP